MSLTVIVDGKVLTGAQPVWTKWDHAKIFGTLFLMVAACSAIAFATGYVLGRDDGCTPAGRGWPTDLEEELPA